RAPRARPGLIELESFPRFSRASRAEKGLANWSNHWLTEPVSQMSEKPAQLVPFEPPARRRLHHAVAEQLRDAVLDGRFRAGEKLPPERELAQEFAVSRASVREAIQGLERLGLVVVRQGDGATVQPLTDASLDVLPAMIFHGG